MDVRHALFSPKLKMEHLERLARSLDCLPNSLLDQLFREEISLLELQQEIENWKEEDLALAKRLGVSLEELSQLRKDNEFFINLIKTKKDNRKMSLIRIVSAKLQEDRIESGGWY